MNSALLRFLASLATDSQLMELYLRDPKSAIGRFNLPDEEARLIVDKKVDALERGVISNLLGEGVAVTTSTGSVIIIPPPPPKRTVTHLVFTPDSSVLSHAGVQVLEEDATRVLQQRSRDPVNTDGPSDARAAVAPDPAGRKGSKIPQPPPIPPTH